MAALQAVLAGATLAAVFGGLVWRMFVHFDTKNESRIERLDAKNESRIERLDAKNESRVERLDAKNEQAHAAIIENIKALRSGQDAIARDLAHLAGRQAERDQQAGRAGG